MPVDLIAADDSTIAGSWVSSARPGGCRPDRHARIALHRPADRLESAAHVAFTGRPSLPGRSSHGSRSGAVAGRDACASRPLSLRIRKLLRPHAAQRAVLQRRRCADQSRRWPRPGRGDRSRVRKARHERGAGARCAPVVRGHARRLARAGLQPRIRPSHAQSMGAAPSCTSRAWPWPFPIARSRVDGDWSAANYRAMDTTMLGAIAGGSEASHVLADSLIERAYPADPGLIFDMVLYVYGKLNPSAYCDHVFGAVPSQTESLGVHERARLGAQPSVHAVARRARQSVRVGACGRVAQPARLRACRRRSTRWSRTT